MFGRDSLPARIYAYKCKPPKADAGLGDALDQMRKAHRYRNALVELELNRRAESEAVLRELCPEFVAAQTAYQEAKDALEAHKDGLRRENQRARAKRATAEQRNHKRELNDACKDAYSVFKAVKAASYAEPVVKQALADAEIEHAKRKKLARKESGLHWGSYLTIEQASMGMRQGPPPRYHAWDGEGTIAVQIQGGLDWAEAVTKGHGQLRVEILPTGAIAHPSARPQAGSRRQETRQRALVSLRIGTDEKRKPIWVTVLTHIHRTPPPGARIKWVHLAMHGSPRHRAWTVRFTLAREEGWGRDDGADSGIAGIDLGWRLLADRLRVAVLIDADGRREECAFSRTDLDRWAKAESLGAIRDRNFDEIRVQLGEWLSARNGDAPEWLRERLRFLAKWRSCARLASVVIAWRDQRFDGDIAIFQLVEAWRKQDKHLMEWQWHQRRSAIRWRDDQLRRFARKAFHRYKTIVIEDCKWNQVVKRPDVDESDENKKSRYYSRIASVGTLARYIEETGATVLRAPAAHTTTTCHRCGSRETFDAAVELRHRCSACDAEWDQDDNAARNLLAWGRGVAEPVA